MFYYYYIKTPQGEFARMDMHEIPLSNTIREAAFRWVDIKFADQIDRIVGSDVVSWVKLRDFLPFLWVNIYFDEDGNEKSLDADNADQQIAIKYKPKFHGHMVSYYLPITYIQ